MRKNIQIVVTIEFGIGKPIEKALSHLGLPLNAIISIRDQHDAICLLAQKNAITPAMAEHAFDKLGDELYGWHEAVKRGEVR